MIAKGGHCSGRRSHIG